MPKKRGRMHCRKVTYTKRYINRIFFLHIKPEFGQPKHFLDYRCSGVVQFAGIYKGTSSFLKFFNISLKILQFIVDEPARPIRISVYKIYFAGKNCHTDNVAF